MASDKIAEVAAISTGGSRLADQVAATMAKKSLENQREIGREAVQLVEAAKATVKPEANTGAPSQNSRINLTA